jgi:hypothetical protein
MVSSNHFSLAYAAGRQGACRAGHVEAHMKRVLCALALVAFGAAPALADPKSDVLAAMIGFAKASSYHISVIGKSGAIEGDMALPAKMHIMSPQFEMIKIDSTTWVKVSGGWRQFNMPGMEQMTAGLNEAIATARGKEDDLVVTDLGMKLPGGGGRPLHAYSVTNKAGKSPSTVFLDRGTLVEVDGSDGTAVKFSKFNAPVEISPPP